MQRFHNLQPLPQHHLLLPMAPSQPLNSFLVIDHFRVVSRTSHKSHLGLKKQIPKSLQPTPRKLDIVKIQSFPPVKEQAKVMQRIKEEQASKPSKYIEKKMGLGSKKKRDKMKEFILETLLKAKAQGNCLVISKGTAQPQSHVSPLINKTKTIEQSISKKQVPTCLQPPKALKQGNSERPKPQASSLIIPSVKTSKRLLKVAKEMADQRERKEKILSKRQQTKQPEQLDLLQIQLIQEKIQVQQEKQIQEQIIVASIEY